MTDKQVLFDFTPDFDFTEDVRFKYVLLETSEQRLLVRGWTRAEFHADVAEESERREKIKCTVIGGGRIHVNNKRILVYGHSLGFPWPPGHPRNQLVAELIRQNMTDMQVTWSNDGY